MSGSDSSLSSLTPKHSKIPLRMTPTSPTHKSESQSPPNSDLRSPDMQHPISNQEGQRNSGGFELSPPQLSYPVVTELNTSTNARSPSSGSGALVNTSYRAIKDYNPEDFSTSGHQSLELKLKEGDIVRVLGQWQPQLPQYSRFQNFLFEMFLADEIIDNYWICSHMLTIKLLNLICTNLNLCLEIVIHTLKRVEITHIFTAQWSTLDARFWRLKSTPALEELNISKGRRPLTLVF